MPETKFFGDLVDLLRGEVTIAIGAGNFRKEFYDAMDEARQYGYNQAMKDHTELSRPVSMPDFCNQ